MTRTLIGLILVLAGFSGLGALGWHLVGEQIRNRQEYRLTADNVIVSQKPDWITDQFVEDVLRTSGLNRSGSLLDKTLPQKLAEAFFAHPWVEQVEQVKLRHPSGADVKLVYRAPIALVEVIQPGMQRSIIPVDRNGVVLPTDFLTRSESEQNKPLLTIQGVQSSPLGSVGAPWGDPLVQSAAQLAGTLDDIARPLKLASIIPATEEFANGVRIVCRLQTASGAMFHWGGFTLGDPKLEAKKKRLLDLSEQFRSLDYVPENFRDLSNL